MTHTQTAVAPAVTNADVVALDRANVFHSWSAQKTLNPLVIAGGSGSTVWDHDVQAVGKRARNEVAVRGRCHGVPLAREDQDRHV